MRLRDFGITWRAAASASEPLSTWTADLRLLSLELPCCSGSSILSCFFIWRLHKWDSWRSALLSGTGTLYCCAENVLGASTMRTVRLYIYILVWCFFVCSMSESTQSITSYFRCMHRSSNQVRCTYASQRRQHGLLHTKRGKYST